MLYRRHRTTIWHLQDPRERTFYPEITQIQNEAVANASEAALAALAATGAFAQSTVTLFGVVDTGYRSVESGTNKFSGMANGSNASNRLGFRGTEDLGGGMRASFHMEGDLAPNDGTSTGFRFLRQSTIGLVSSMGEVRLGRDYTPLFRVHGIVDPFGTVGVGNSGNMMWSTVSAVAVNGTAMGAQTAQDQTGTFTTTDRGTERRTDASGLRAAAYLTPRTTFADPNAVRANNSFAYYSPNISGSTVSAMYSTGAQNTYNLKNIGKMAGMSLNYPQGPLVLAAANQVTKGGYTAAAASVAVTSGTATVNGTDITATNGTDDQKWTTNYLAGSYDLRVVKLGLGYRTDKPTNITGVTDTVKNTIISASAPLGAVTMKASYITKKVGDNKAGNQIAVGAVYDLSKRTALYTTYASLKNEAGYANTVGSAPSSAGGVTSKGFDIGVRHSF